MRCKILGLALMGLILSSCSSVSGWFSGDSEQGRLPGERISVLELQEKIEPADAALQVGGLITPPAWQNEFWPQAGGYPNHAMQNLALNEGELTQIWRADIGEGAHSERPLTATPIVIDGFVYTMDSRSTVSSFNAENGKLVWRTAIKKPDEDETVISGGLGYSTGTIFATNGFNEVVALAPADGKIKWRKTLPAAVRGAPTIMDGRVFVQTLDNRLITLNAADGTIIWAYQGSSEMAGLVGASSPAVNQDIVIAGFSNGDLTALRVANGAYAWSDNLSSIKRFGGLAGISDIKGLPVLDRDMVFAASFGGKLVALDAIDGKRIWQREIGSSNTPWVAGNHLFILTNDNQLVAIGRERGVIRWVTKIAPEARKTPAFTGPVLAGGRLFVAGTQGHVVEVDPQSGEILRQWDAGQTISIPMIVAAGTLYTLGDDGTLRAYK
jgi:outer membrane protein assembly factor BamB